jgi:hypothetical protein
MKTLIVLLLIGLLMPKVALLAQDPSQEIESVGWTRLGFSKKLAPRISASVAPQLILQDNFSRVGSMLTDFGLSYKLHPMLSLSGAYRLVARFPEGEAAISTRHQLLLNLSSSYRITSGLKLYYRFRYQTQSPEILEFMHTETLNSSQYFRNRLKLRYSANYYLRPWMSYELFHRMGHPRRGNYLRADRLLLGLDLRVDERNRLNVFVGPQNRLDRNDRPLRMIFGTTYSVSF